MFKGSGGWFYPCTIIVNFQRTWLPSTIASASCDSISFPMMRLDSLHPEICREYYKIMKPFLGVHFPSRCVGLCRQDNDLAALYSTCSSWMHVFVADDTFAMF